MKLLPIRHPRLFLPILAILGCLLLPSLTHAEEINRFATVITLGADSSFLVTESIAYDFGSENRHGIFRYIPKRHPQGASAWYKKRHTNIEVLSVTRGNQAEPYTVDEDGSRVALKIGDPGKTVTGEHVYVIEYRVTGGLSYLDDGVTELYWNATAHDTTVHIAETAVLISDPKKLTLPEYSCYRGRVYESRECAVASSTAEGLLFADGSLSPGEGVTVAVALKADRVPVVMYETIRWAAVIPLLLLGLLLWFSVWLYRSLRQHRPAGRTVIAQYEPYADVLPMYTGVLMDGRLDDRDLTAGLLKLAQDGFITITKTNQKVLWVIEVDDYEVVLKRPVSEAPTEFHKTLLELLFGDTLPGTMVSLNSLKKNQSRQRKNYQKLTKLKAAVKKDLVAQGFYEKFGLFNMFRRRTKKGYDAKWHLKGFKQFLSVTDKERFAFHNAPAKNPEQFMTFLPFAIAFAVERQWADVFKDMALPPQHWYTDVSGAQFDVGSFTTNLGAFSSAFKGASGSGYRSSSSASGGGGFSGGGGGGGSVGSW